MNSSGLNQGTSGNVSVRVPGGFLITPSGIPYASLSSSDIVFVELSKENPNASGYYGDRLPSSEWRMHRDVYINFPSAEAVVHTHSTFATALSALRSSIPAFHYMVGVSGGKCIPCANYETFGSQELSNSIVNVMSKHSVCACLLSNHGVITYGKSLKKALYVASEVETLARQYVYAKSLGEPTILDDEEMDVILAKFKTYGKQAEEIECMCEFDRENAVIPPKRLG
eukprot:g5929.t1